MTTTTLTLEQVEQLATRALQACGASETQAKALAAGVAGAERDGISSHGLVYVPIYCEHLKCGKVLGDAIPSVEQPRPSSIRVNAGSGFAHAAIDAGFKRLMEAASTNGSATLSVNNSYNCGVLGFHTERLAKAGYIGLGFTNAPASIAPAGGNKPVIGTNPFSVAVSDADGVAICIDQSASVVAKSEVMAHARAGKAIPDHWTKDAQGNPTTDPQEGLKGSMAPSGGYKGVGTGILVEILAAALSGASLGIHASPFSGTVGGPPKTGQCFIAIDPEAFGGKDSFNQRIVDLCQAIEAQEGAKIPGSKRRAHRIKADAEGVQLSDELIARVEALIA